MAMLTQTDNPQSSILSTRNLAHILGYKRKRLIEIANSAHSYYHPFNKLKPKRREIDNPTGELKIAQKRIDNRILKKILLPAGIVGGVKGKSILDNAAFHTKKKIVVALDLKECFPSTHHTNVFTMFRNQLGYGEESASLMTKLTTYNGYVPQGSPCSSSLINLCLLPLYYKLESFANKNKLTISQWVDDITISGDSPEHHIAKFIELIEAQGYACRAKKIKVMRSNKRQEVTGLGVNKKPSVTNRIQDIRKMILNARDLKKENLDQQKSVIKGKMQFIRSIDPTKYGKLLIFANKVFGGDF